MEEKNYTDNISEKHLENCEIQETNSEENLYDFFDNEVPSFVRLTDKYNDIISSAFTMLLVGSVGFIFMVLALTKIIPLPISAETSWLFNSIMGGVFIIFIIAGIVSFMHAKQVKIDAQAEDKLIEEILSWADENITTAMLDKDLDLTQPVELLYFNRSDRIKDSLMHHFENANEALIYEYTEQIYQKLYEPNENNTDNNNK
jgi:hypothetical protein